MRQKNQPTVKAPLSVSLTDSPAARLCSPRREMARNCSPSQREVRPGIHTEWHRNERIADGSRSFERDAYKAAVTRNNPGRYP